MMMIKNEIVTAKELIIAGWKFTGKIIGPSENENVWRMFKSGPRLILLEDLGLKQYRFLMEV